MKNIICICILLWNSVALAQTAYPGPASGVDVRVFGVDMTGMTDSTIAMQAAMAYGGKLSIPPGTVAVSSSGTPVSCSKDGTVVTGSGFSTIIQNASATADTFTVDDDVTACRFTGMHFTVAPSVAMKTAGAFVNCGGSNLCQVDNFWMYGFFTGIELTGTSSRGTEGARFLNGLMSGPAGISSNGVLVSPRSGGYNSVDVVVQNILIAGDVYHGNCGVNI